MTASYQADRLPAHQWPVLMKSSGMDERQARFYHAIWYAAGLAWTCGVADEALMAICDVVRETQVPAHRPLAPSGPSGGGQGPGAGCETISSRP
jgi:hypothetical protein